jgi:stearoyl-CoA desaturase (delta-9 desaturase)
MNLIATERVTPLPDTTLDGRILWDAPKSLWWFGHALGAIVAVVVFPAWDAAAVMIALTAITICAGHSVGMHRLLIHRTFQTPLWLERLLVWLGTLVGMAGPISVFDIHEIRDWHQHQTVCPPHPAHSASFWQDGWLQLHCKFVLNHPPQLTVEDRVLRDPFYRFVERTWRFQQLPLALGLWLIGGWAWVFWGISARIVLSLTGHWAVVHFSHKGGHQGWRVEGLPVQGYNLPHLGLITFGEAHHGNHHAFPHSAKLGLEAGQIDPGYWFIRGLEKLGLAQGIKLPQDEPPRAGLARVHGHSKIGPPSLFRHR